MTSRRTFSQIVMWIILLGTVGLAAALDQHVENANRVELSSPVMVKGVSFCLPVRWEASEPDAKFAIACVQEPQDPHRVLTVYAQRVKPGTLAEQYLRAVGFFETVELGKERSIPFGDRSGIIYMGHYEDVPVVLACSILPSGIAVTIRVDGGESPLVSEKLVKLIAETVHAVGENNPV